MPYRSPLLPDRYPQQDLFVCSHILQTAYLSEIEYTFFDCQMIKSRGQTTKSKTNRQLRAPFATMKQGPAAAALTKVIANSTNVKFMRLRGSLEELIERTAHTGRVSPRTAENVNQMSIL